MHYRKKNGKARVKISKGSIHSGKTRVVYTLQIGTARQPLMAYTTQFIQHIGPYEASFFHT